MFILLALVLLLSTWLWVNHYQAQNPFSMKETTYFLMRLQKKHSISYKIRSLGRASWTLVLKMVWGCHPGQQTWMPWLISNIYNVWERENKRTRSLPWFKFFIPWLAKQLSNFLKILNMNKCRTEQVLISSWFLVLLLHITLNIPEYILYVHIHLL